MTHTCIIVTRCMHLKMDLESFYSNGTRMCDDWEESRLPRSTS